MQFQTLDHEQVLRILPDRKRNSHKGDYGKILLLCGSRGYTGAAALAAMGALRTGAGLVYLGVPESIYEIEAIKLTECIVFPLSDDGGMLSQQTCDKILPILPNMDAVLIGCGSGLSDGMYEVIRIVLSHYSGPVVLDADGINLIARNMDLLRGRTGITILTPHEGEFKRMGYCITDRVSDAIGAARDLSCIIVLKGNRTVITDGEQLYVNLTGNPGMATGGSGDVLAGMIVSLLGQSIDPIQASAAAVWLHGAAGDICAEKMGMYSMLPSDMLCALPRLMK